MGPFEGVLYLPGVFRICKLCTQLTPHLLEAAPPYFWALLKQDRDVSKAVPSVPKVRPHQHIPGRSCHSGTLSATGSCPFSHTLPFRTPNSSPRQKPLCSLLNPLNKLRFTQTKARRKEPLQSPHDKGVQRARVKTEESSLDRAVALSNPPAT